MSSHQDTPELTGTEIAIVGLAGRFPGADSVEALWAHLRDGVESVTEFNAEELAARGVTAEQLADPHYVRAGVVLDGMDQFDAGYFGYVPRDAQQLDPQQRVLLETAVQALEHAGYGASGPLTGVYAGCGANLYLMRHLLPAGSWQTQDISSLLGLLNGNDKDSLATRLAFKLDLRGPAVTVQTACSTSLVAVHLACRGLLNHETDMALAGGVWLNLLQQGGYRHQPGAILSADGHCRAFDAQASGTVIGSGAGLVVLKRLADALADGDTLHAVIKGSALNNDGAAKVGFTAPSVDGQAEVILAAQAMAEVSPDSISYIEAHGTGTSLGDPIEIAALTQAFRAGTQKRGYCAIGSLKTNIGHLDAAAGVAGLIKTVLALKHQTLPPSLNFRAANPQIDFAGSPFYVNTEARAWPSGATPRRAGVSSFGMGGTNVHVILEEAPPVRLAAPATPGDALLRLSARSAAALEAATQQLQAHLAQPGAVSLTDVEHTLRVGRKRFDHRAVVLARDAADAQHVLVQRTPHRFFSGLRLSERPSVAFLFPGQGSQHVAMGRALYDTEPVYREMVDRCCERLRPSLDLDLRSFLHAAEAQAEDASERLAQTAITQPALFVVEYAMAQWWLSRGLQPDALLGHSIGEYVAACLAGVFSLDDALAVVAARGRLLQATPAGAMLAVGVPEAELQAWLGQGCDLAAVNAADLCVLSGTPAAIAAAEDALARRGAALKRLHVERAFHSALVEPMLDEFEALLSRIKLQAPKIPFISNLSGRWITAEEACSPRYWRRHVRGTVRFAAGVGELLAKPDRVLLEVGPGESLTTLARRHPQAKGLILASQCAPTRREGNAEQLTRCVAQLWVAGLETEVAASPHTARRVPLPTYPFERQSYWVERAEPVSTLLPPSELAAGLYAPIWQRTPALPKPDRPSTGCALVLADAQGLGSALLQHLQAQGQPAAWVEPGAKFARVSPFRYSARPDDRHDLAQVLQAVEAEQGPVTTLWHLWSLGTDSLPHGFHSLMALAQALEGSDRKRLCMVVTDEVADVTGVEALSAIKATVHGPAKVIPQEYPQLDCRLIDVLRPAHAAERDRLVQQLLAEAVTPRKINVQGVAYRGAHRWVQTFELLPRDASPSQRLKSQGVYVITGGLGGMGQALAQHLARHWQARLVLLGRTAGAAEATPQVQALEALGAEVLVRAADVSDAPQLQAALAQARQRFGRINGVIHAAGVAGGGLIAQRSRAAVERVWAPKVQGTQNLLQAFSTERPDFVLLCSSLSALTGGFGQVDYVAANCVLDACAAQAARQGLAVLSVNWDAWREVGMAAHHALPEGVGITPTQGGALLEQLLAGPARPQTVVSTLALARQFEAHQSTELAQRLLPAATPKRQPHARPALATPYAEPSSEIEQDLAVLWGEFLGLTPIGVHDNLFELGGDSLLAIQLLARVRSAYGVELHPAGFFKSPTVAELALLVETRLIEEIEQADAAPAVV